MHISASAPLSIKEDGVDKEVLERETNIFESQAKESGKDENIMQKMVEGKIKRFLKEVTLLSQDFIKDPDTSISKLLENSDNEVISFERFKVGEGIEVSSKDNLIISLNGKKIKIKIDIDVQIFCQAVIVSK